MRVKHFNVNIVNRNLQIEVVSRDTYSPYMEVKSINVSIVNRNMQIEVVSRDTYHRKLFKK